MFVEIVVRHPLQRETSEGAQVGKVAGKVAARGARGGLAWSSWQRDSTSAGITTRVPV